MTHCLSKEKPKDFHTLIDKIKWQKNAMAQFLSRQNATAAAKIIDQIQKVAAQLAFFPVNF